VLETVWQHFKPLSRWAYFNAFVPKHTDGSWAYQWKCWDYRWKLLISRACIVPQSLKVFAYSLMPCPYAWSELVMLESNRLIEVQSCTWVNFTFWKWLSHPEPDNFSAVSMSSFVHHAPLSECPGLSQSGGAKRLIFSIQCSSFVSASVLLSVLRDPIVIGVCCLLAFK